MKNGLLLFIICSLLLGTLFGVLVKSNSRLGMVTQFVFLPSVLLSGIMFPGNMLPAILETAGKFLPASWGFIIMNDSTFIGSHILVLLLMIVVMCVVILWRIKELYKN